MRRITTHIRYSEDEFEKLEKRALSTGLTKSAYIRNASLGIVPKESPSAEFYEDMKLLRNISHNLNQIAVVANKYNFIDVEKLRGEIGKVNDFMMSIKKKYL